ncbi:GntR family transcriptional regulator [Atopobium sp. oral taxon 810]|uniref:GntR family transcriptional regulator n=1 Tax=Atopobium sp. oral taxon 810 TaxID=712158 RepID=UPI0003981FE8|nr:GntR family transcriptional regulator [Atopobium sp. oral taxon 810]ERI05484.1 UbiC transcription regulator-associated domain protein [Atopobium sp. oral taxon 810 str. F0209]
MNESLLEAEHTDPVTPLGEIVDTSSGGLLYLALESDIRQKVLSGEYAVGDHIPTESELCNQYGVSRITVRRAVQNLVEDGVLKKIRGRGTFVMVPKHVIKVTSIEGAGWKSNHHDVYERALVPASASIAASLQVAEGEGVQFIRRLIREEDFPIAIDELYVSPTICPGLLDLMHDDVSFYSLVDKHYHLAFGIEDLTIDTSIARSDEAQLLKCAVGAPLFILRKVMWCADGKPMHFSKSIVRGDRVSYHFRVNRDGSIVNDGREFTLSVK